MLLSVQATTVLGYTLPFKIDKNCFGTCFHGNFLSAVGSRHRVAIGIKTDSTEPIHPAGDSFTGIEGISGKRIQLIFFTGKHNANGGIFASDLVGKILLAFIQEHSIEFLYGFCSGNRDANIASNIAHQTFYQPLFISGCRVAEYSLKAVVSSQSGVASLFTGMSTKAIFDSDFSVIKDNSSRHTSEILEHLNQSVQKAFFILSSIGKNYGSAAVTKTSTKEIDCSFDTTQIDGGFTPVDLHGISRREGQWHKCILRRLSEFPNQTSDGCLAAGKTAFFYQTLINTLGSMVLLSGTDRKSVV